MILNFNELYVKYNLKINGVIHVGAHIGQEHKIYIKHNISKIKYFEPNPVVFLKLKENVKISEDVEIFNVALGNKNQVMDFYLSSNEGGSSSILKPKKHLIQHPNITFNEKIKVNMKRLDEFKIPKNFNFINMDVQGYELEVLKGGIETLRNVDYVMSEVNRDEVYENCTKINELDDFLNNYNFKRVEVNWAGNIWGDAFYIKNK